MEGTFIDRFGMKKTFDLDLLKLIARGKSNIQRGWSGTLVFCPQNRVLVELRSSPPSVRGDSKGEASEVTLEYATTNYDVDASMLESCLSK